VKLQTTTQSWSRSRVVFYTITPILMAVGAWLLAAVLVGLAAAVIGWIFSAG
jgi:hypothetical protein